MSRRSNRVVAICVAFLVTLRGQCFHNTNGYNLEVGEFEYKQTTLRECVPESESDDDVMSFPCDSRVATHSAI